MCLNLIYRKATSLSDELFNAFFFNEKSFIKEGQDGLLKWKVNKREQIKAKIVLMLHVSLLSVPAPTEIPLCIDTSFIFNRRQPE